MTYGTAYFKQGIEVAPSADNTETLQLYNIAEKACFSLSSTGTLTAESGSLSAPTLSLDDSNFSIVSKVDHNGDEIYDPFFRVGLGGVFLSSQTSADSGSLSIDDTIVSLNGLSITLGADTTLSGSLIVDGQVNPVINANSEVNGVNVESQGELTAYGTVKAKSDFKAGYNAGTDFYKVEIDVDGLVQMKNDQDSSTYEDGSLVVYGGVGVAKNLNVGGDLKVDGKFSAPNFKTETISYDSANTVEVVTAPLDGSCMVLVRGDQGYTATYVMSKLVGSTGVITRLSHGISATNEGIATIEWGEINDLIFTRSSEWTTGETEQNYYITLISS